jgi:phosphatidylglycerol:prolipoprotein diacylglycerol transferase
MYPHPFQAGPFSVTAYGLLLVVGFVIALVVTWRLARVAGLDPERVHGLACGTVIAGLLGAHCLHVCTQLDAYRGNPLAALRIWDGHVFIGGPLAGILFLAWCARRHRLPFWTIADVLVVAMLIALVFGRLGCLTAGCCHGRPTGCSFGVQLNSDFVSPECRAVPLHPTQLYEACAGLLLFVGLLRLFPRRAFAGQVVLTFFIAYPLIRFVIELFRGDASRGFVFNEFLSTSQFVCLLVLPVAVGLWIVRSRPIRARVPPSGIRAIIAPAVAAETGHLQP